MKVEMRKEYEELILKQKNIDKKISELVTHPNGKSYNAMLRSLLTDLVRELYKPNNTYDEFHKYSSIRNSISKTMDIKTQIYVKEEYIQALEIIRKKYNYSIPEEYLV